MPEKPEQYFARRMRRIFSEDGWLVLNCASAQLFDCVVLKNNLGFLIEFKARRTPHPQEQKRRQIREAIKTNNSFCVIRQSKTRGKVILGLYLIGSPYYQEIFNTLKGYLIHFEFGEIV